MRHNLPLLSLLTLSACVISPAQSPPETLGFNVDELDSAVDPAADFYAYVNGKFLARTKIPPEWSSYGVMQVLYEQTEAQLLDIVTAATSSTTTRTDGQKKIGDLYSSFMDTTRVEALGLSPLTKELRQIDSLSSHAEVMSYFGRGLRLGLQVPINFYIDADAKDPERSLVYFWQDGLGLPDRDYYLEANPQLEGVREKYRMHIARMYELADWKDGEVAAANIIGLEQGIAEQHWTRVQNRDRERIYNNKFSLDAANRLSPQFKWSAILHAGQFGELETFVVAQTDYFSILGKLVSTSPVADWKNYLRFKLLKAYAPYLSQKFVAEDFDFQRRVLRGQEKPRERWQRGIRLINASLGEVVGQAYVQRHFAPRAKSRMEKLVENLRKAFAQSIDTLDWMSEPTRKQAHEKLEKFRAKIGYPNRWRDYGKLRIERNDLVGNVRRARVFEHDRQLAKLKKPVDREEWGMTPQTVNAYYRATLNEIVFPAAILQPPFFDMDADDALNYGAIGAVIGHEFSHGFDDQGRKFDGDGRLRDWWTSADAQEYQRRASRLIEQYNKFQPLPDVSINGELTLGENIADLAGVVVAYRAYLLSLNGKQAPVIGGFTGPQRFFIGYALSWKNQYREDFLREILLSDPHSPAEYRVRGALQNMPEFHEAFKVDPSAAMYLGPEDRVSIW